jgi:hypothetical protein
MPWNITAVDRPTHTTNWQHRFPMNPSALSQIIGTAGMVLGAQMAASGNFEKIHRPCT